MKNCEPIPEIAEIVQHWMPNASEEELKAATINLRDYLAVVHRIFLRLDAENRNRDTRARDNLSIGDTVEATNHDHV